MIEIKYDSPANFYREVVRRTFGSDGMIRTKLYDVVKIYPASYVIENFSHVFDKMYDAESESEYLSTESIESEEDEHAEVGTEIETYGEPEQSFDVISSKFIRVGKNSKYYKASEMFIYLSKCINKLKKKKYLSELKEDEFLKSKYPELISALSDVDTLTNAIKIIKKYRAAFVEETLGINIELNSLLNIIENTLYDKNVNTLLDRVKDGIKSMNLYESLRNKIMDYIKDNTNYEETIDVSISEVLDQAIDDVIKDDEHLLKIKKILMEELNNYHSIIEITTNKDIYKKLSTHLNKAKNIDDVDDFIQLLINVGATKTASEIKKCKSLKCAKKIFSEYIETAKRDVISKKRDYRIAIDQFPIINADDIIEITVEFDKPVKDILKHYTMGDDYIVGVIYRYYLKKRINAMYKIKNIYKDNTADITFTGIDGKIYKKKRVTLFKIDSENKEVSILSNPSTLKNDRYITIPMLYMKNSVFYISVNGVDYYIRQMIYKKSVNNIILMSPIHAYVNAVNFIANAHKTKKEWVKVYDIAKINIKGQFYYKDGFSDIISSTNMTRFIMKCFSYSRELSDIHDTFKQRYASRLVRMWYGYRHDYPNDRLHCNEYRSPTYKYIKVKRVRNQTTYRDKFVSMGVDYSLKHIINEDRYLDPFFFGEGASIGNQRVLRNDCRVKTVMGWVLYTTNDKGELTRVNVGEGDRYHEIVIETRIESNPVYGDDNIESLKSVASMSIPSKLFNYMSIKRINNVCKNIINSCDIEYLYDKKNYHSSEHPDMPLLLSNDIYKIFPLEGLNAPARVICDKDPEILKIKCHDGAVVISRKLSNYLRYSTYHPIQIDPTYIKDKYKKMLMEFGFIRVRRGENIYDEKVTRDESIMKTDGLLEMNPQISHVSKKKFRALTSFIERLDEFIENFNKFIKNMEKMKAGEDKEEKKKSYFNKLWDDYGVDEFIENFKEMLRSSERQEEFVKMAYDNKASYTVLDIRNRIYYYREEFYNRVASGKKFYFRVVDDMYDDIMFIANYINERDAEWMEAYNNVLKDKNFRIFALESSIIKNNKLIASDETVKKLRKYAVTRPTEVGNKLIALSGGKWIVSMIIDEDEDYTVIENGRIYKMSGKDILNGADIIVPQNKLSSNAILQEIKLTSRTPKEEDYSKLRGFVYVFLVPKRAYSVSNSAKILKTSDNFTEVITSYDDLIVNDLYAFNKNRIKKFEEYLSYMWKSVGYSDEIRESYMSNMLYNDRLHNLLTYLPINESVKVNEIKFEDGEKILLDLNDVKMDDISKLMRRMFTHVEEADEEFYIDSVHGKIVEHNEDASSEIISTDESEVFISYIKYVDQWIDDYRKYKSILKEETTEYDEIITRQHNDSHRYVKFHEMLGFGENETGDFEHESYFDSEYFTKSLFKYLPNTDYTVNDLHALIKDLSQYRIRSCATQLIMNKMKEASEKGEPVVLHDAFKNTLITKRGEVKKIVEEIKTGEMIIAPKFTSKHVRDIMNHRVRESFKEFIKNKDAMKVVIDEYKKIVKKCIDNIIIKVVYNPFDPKQLIWYYAPMYYEYESDIDLYGKLKFHNIYKFQRDNLFFKRFNKRTGNIMIRSSIDVNTLMYGKKIIEYYMNGKKGMIDKFVCNTSVRGGYMTIVPSYPDSDIDYLMRLVDYLSYSEEYETPPILRFMYRVKKDIVNNDDVKNRLNTIASLIQDAVDAVNMGEKHDLSLVDIFDSMHELIDFIDDVLSADENKNIVNKFAVLSHIDIEMFKPYNCILMSQSTFDNLRLKKSNMLIVYREPVVHKGSMQVLRPIISNQVTDDVVAISPHILKPFNADYDGDNIFMIKVNILPREGGYLDAIKMIKSMLLNYRIDTMNRYHSKFDIRKYLIERMSNDSKLDVILLDRLDIREEDDTVVMDIVTDDYLIKEIDLLNDDEILFNERLMGDVYKNPVINKELIIDDAANKVVREIKQYRIVENDRQAIGVVEVGHMRKKLAFHLQCHGSKAIEIASIANVETGMGKKGTAVEEIESIERYVKYIKQLYNYLKKKKYNKEYIEENKLEGEDEYIKYPSDEMFKETDDSETKVAKYLMNKWVKAKAADCRHATNYAVERIYNRKDIKTYISNINKIYKSYVAIEYGAETADMSGICIYGRSIIGKRVPVKGDELVI